MPRYLCSIAVHFLNSRANEMHIRVPVYGSDMISPTGCALLSADSPTSGFIFHNLCVTVPIRYIYLLGGQNGDWPGGRMWENKKKRLWWTRSKWNESDEIFSSTSLETWCWRYNTKPGKETHSTKCALFALATLTIVFVQSQHRQKQAIPSKFSWEVYYKEWDSTVEPKNVNQK